MVVSQLWIESSTSYAVNHIRPIRNTAFFHQDSKFDGNDGHTLNKKIVHHIS